MKIKTLIELHKQKRLTLIFDRHFSMYVQDPAYNKIDIGFMASDETLKKFLDNPLYHFVIHTNYNGYDSFLTIYEEYGIENKKFKERMRENPKNKNYITNEKNSFIVLDSWAESGWFGDLKKIFHDINFNDYKYFYSVILKKNYENHSFRKYNHNVLIYYVTQMDHTVAFVLFNKSINPKILNMIKLKYNYSEYFNCVTCNTYSITTMDQFVQIAEDISSLYTDLLDTELVIE